MERESVEDRPDPPARGTNREPDAPFGVRLKKLREVAGLTQEELASRAGLTAKAVSALERGERRRPYPHTVRSLSEALELPDAERASLLAAVPGRGEKASTPATGAPPTVLPTPTTALVGRERDVETVVALIGQPEIRLLTLTGTGGVGKTRLATEAARASLAAGVFPDGIVFVALASLGDAALVIPTIARSLPTAGEAEGRSPRESLRAYLRDKRLLLVLDNFEHLLGAAPEVVALMEACPGLTVLATSRAPLRVRGEREYPVPPLDVPDPTRVPRLEDVVGAPAVELFVQRAREASPTFEPSEANAAAVAAICWRLDGLPLALELAAAKTRFLGPTALLSRLDRALAASGARDLPERQRTMRATLDWSYGLLQEPEKDLFARLSVFAGGFTLEAAETVGEARGSGDEDVLELLGRLVEQSLIVAEPDEDDIRYRMLEPVRQYALEKLEESGDGEEARLRHAGYFLALAERARPRLRGREEGEWLDRLETELGNLRTAIGWSLGQEDGEMGLRLAAELWYFWYKRGHMSEGRRWLEEALGKGTAPITARAEALNGAGALARNQADYEQAQEWLEESLVLKRELGDKKGAAEVLINLGTVAFDRGDYPRSAALESESLSLWRELGDRWGIALALNNLGITVRARGALAEAASLYEESLDLFRALEDRAGIAMVLSNLGAVAEGEGEYAKAATFYQESLEMYREVGEKRGIALLTGRLGGIARIQGDYARAAALYDESLLLHRELGDRRGISQDLEGVAAMLAARGQPETAVRLWAAVEALRERIGAPPNDIERARYEPLVATAREALGEEAFANVWAEGRKLTPEQALDAW
jgi:predicted ATPase/transcriptional regulator with XRE-family HTH domain